MRLLTKSVDQKGGLEMIQESNNDSQNIIFCIPFPKDITDKITDLNSLRTKLINGFSAKIVTKNKSETIFFKLNNNTKNSDLEFVTKVLDQKVRFYISDLNYDNNNFKIHHFYSGSNYNYDFENVLFLILEPNLNDLDRLYKNHKIIFRDFY